MKLVILESPYTGDIEHNVAFARKCLRDCILRGEAPIASHLLYTQPGVLRDEIIDERVLGIRCGLAWRRVADYSVFYTDRGWSRGMKAAFNSIIDSPAGAYRIRGIHSENHLPPDLTKEQVQLARLYVEFLDG